VCYFLSPTEKENENKYIVARNRPYFDRLNVSPVAIQKPFCNNKHNAKSQSDVADRFPAPTFL
jgi:hypothetical protein